MLLDVCMLGALVPAGEGLPTGAGNGEVHWWNYLYSTLVCAMCLVVGLVGGAVYGKTTVFIFAVCYILTTICCFMHTSDGQI